jgi:hypothetical protein
MNHSSASHITKAKISHFKRTVIGTHFIQDPLETAYNFVFILLTTSNFLNNLDLHSVRYTFFKHQMYTNKKRLLNLRQTVS